MVGRREFKAIVTYVNTIHHDSQKITIDTKTLHTQNTDEIRNEN